MDVSYPGAVAPARQRFVASLGLRLHVVEWGDAAAPPLLLTHGFYDHARSFDTFAPLLARATACSRSTRAATATPTGPTPTPGSADVLDVVNVLRDLGRPAHLVGHSRGGGLATDAALLFPAGVRRLVNMDGFGPPPEGFQAEGMRRYQGTRARAARRLLRLAPRQRRRAAASGRARASTSWPRAAASRTRASRRSGCATSPRRARARSRAASSGRWTRTRRAASGRGGPSGSRRPGAGSRCRCSRSGATSPTPGACPTPGAASGSATCPCSRRRRSTGAGHFMHIEKPAETAALVLDFLGRA